jgi:hypothetical protein
MARLGGLVLLEGEHGSAVAGVGAMAWSSHFVFFTSIFTKSFQFLEKQ